MANAKEKPEGNTEDTTEDPTEETEESEEDTEEGSEDSAEEPSDEEEGESTVEQYFDLAKVPDHLKAVAKKMQSTHTRKMQALALDSRKAAALDDLLEHPEFKKFLADLEAGNPYGTSARDNSRVSRKGSEEEDEDSGATEGRVNMKEIVKAITPVIQEMVSNSIAPLVRERANETFVRTRERHPDFDDYLPEITKLQKDFPGMSLERAYRLAKAESDEEPRKPNKAEVMKAKKAKTLGPGVAKSGVTSLAPKTVNTLKDALRHAFTEQGIPVD